MDTAGYHKDVTKANINLGYACFQFCFALAGAAFVDKIGRRPLMLFSMGSCCLVWIGMTAASAIFNESGQENSSAARATLSMIFLFGAVYSVGITPLQALYPVEVLSFEMRAKGMAFSSFSVAAGGLLNQFAVSAINGTFSLMLTLDSGLFRSRKLVSINRRTSIFGGRVFFSFSC